MPKEIPKETPKNDYEWPIDRWSQGDDKAKDLVGADDADNDE